jgi:hypothetical protein
MWQRGMKIENVPSFGSNWIKMCHVCNSDIDIMKAPKLLIFLWNCHCLLFCEGWISIKEKISEK